MQKIFKKLCISLVSAFVILTSFGFPIAAEEREVQLSKNYSFSVNQYNSAKIKEIYKDLDELPSSYSLRDLIEFNVGNQGHLNVCEDFSGLKSIETNYFLKTGQYVDLSERWVDYIASDVAYGARTSGSFANSTTGDPLSLQQIVLVGETFGIPTEEDFPFNNDYTALEILNYTPAVSLLSSAVFPRLSECSAEQREGWLKVIKSHVRNYGSVRMGVLGDFQTNKDVSFENPNPVLGDSATISGHAISIIGWDDNYPASNFQDSSITENGAFYCLNSWGKYYGDEGYMWISYHSDSLISAYGALNTETGKSYSYAKNASLLFPSFYADKASTATAYGFKFNDKSYKNHELKKVSLGLGSYNAQQDADKFIVYVNPVDDTFDESKLVAVAIENTIAPGAYSSLTLDEPVVIEGDSFAVVVEMMSSLNSSVYAYAPTETLTDSSYRAFKALNNPDLEWASMDNSLPVYVALSEPNNTLYYVEVKFIDSDNATSENTVLSTLDISSTNPEIDLLYNDKLNQELDRYLDLGYFSITPVPVSIQGKTLEEGKTSLILNLKHERIEEPVEHSYTRQIKFVDAETKTEIPGTATEQTVSYTLNVTKDAVTGDIISTSENTAMFEEFAPGEIEGYNTAGVIVPAEKADQNRTYTVELAKEPINTYTIQFKDMTREVFLEDSITFTSQEDTVALNSLNELNAKLSELSDKHYLFYNVPETISSENPVLVIELYHDTYNAGGETRKTYTRVIHFVDEATNEKIAEDVESSFTVITDSNIPTSLVDGLGVGFANSNLSYDPAPGFPEYVVPTEIGEYVTSPQTIPSTINSISVPPVQFKDEEYTIKYSKQEPVVPEDSKLTVSFVDLDDFCGPTKLEEITLEIPYNSTVSSSPVIDKINHYSQEGYLLEDPDLIIPEVFEYNASDLTINFVHEISEEPIESTRDSLAIPIVYKTADGTVLDPNGSFDYTPGNFKEIDDPVRFDKTANVSLRATSSVYVDVQPLVLYAKDIKGYVCINSPIVLPVGTLLKQTVSTLPSIACQTAGTEILGAITTAYDYTVEFIYEPVSQAPEKVIEVSFVDTDELNPQDLSEYNLRFTVAENQTVDASKIMEQVDKLKAKKYLPLFEEDSSIVIPTTLSYTDESFSVNFRHYITVVSGFYQSDVLVKANLYNIANDSLIDTVDLEELACSETSTSPVYDSTLDIVLEEAHKKMVTNESVTYECPKIEGYACVSSPVTVAENIDIYPELINRQYVIDFYYERLTPQPKSFTVIHNYLDVETGEPISKQVVEHIELDENEIYVIPAVWFSGKTLEGVIRTPDVKPENYEDGQTYVVDYYFFTPGEAVPVTITYKYEDSENLPQEVLDTLPASEFIVVNSKDKEHYVVAAEPSEYYVELGDKVYRFLGWDNTELLIFSPEVGIKPVFTGAWEVQEIPSPKMLDIEIKYDYEMPIGENLIEYEHYTVSEEDRDFTVLPKEPTIKQVCDPEEGCYTFSGWEPRVLRPVSDPEETTFYARWRTIGTPPIAYNAFVEFVDTDKNNPVDLSDYSKRIQFTSAKDALEEIKELVAQLTEYNTPEERAGKFVLVDENDIPTEVEAGETYVIRLAHIYDSVSGISVSEKDVFAEVKDVNGNILGLVGPFKATVTIDSGSRKEDVTTGKKEVSPAIAPRLAEELELDKKSLAQIDDLKLTEETIKFDVTDNISFVTDEEGKLKFELVYKNGTLSLPGSGQQDNTGDNTGDNSGNNSGSNNENQGNNSGNNSGSNNNQGNNNTNQGNSGSNSGLNNTNNTNNSNNSNNLTNSSNNNTSSSNNNNSNSAKNDVKTASGDQIYILGLLTVISLIGLIVVYKKKRVLS